MNFVLAIAVISSVIYSIHAGECIVHHHPDYLSLTANTNNGLTVSDFSNNLATLLGLSADTTSKPLFYSTNTWEIPKSTWLFHVEGFDRLSNGGLTLVDDNGFNIDSIHSKLRSVEHADSLNMGSIVITSNADMANFENTLQKQVAQMDKQALLKYLVIVCDDCQQDKLQTQLKTVVDQIVSNEPEALVMTLVTKETARVRRARDAEAVARNVTIATMYSDEYPTMFNLFFWTSLVFALIIISIVYVFLTLDPGSDTIIYRMTTPRVKVD
ncbi:unnamed protein product [Adineta ricciae]|uniref:Renin receptor-like C-terminal transmembrane spanning segment domain-containing protein n=1 Tax=Adineta ricciae TaxID=249248 RepID=A0A814I7W8_ADIRI|nr:unnamed protein product [Adineta ricciae]